MLCLGLMPVGVRKPDARRSAQSTSEKRPTLEHARVLSVRESERRSGGGVVECRLDYPSTKTGR